MFRIKQQVVLGTLPVLRILLSRRFVQTFTQMVSVSCIQIMLYRVRGASHTVGPPVRQISPVYRSIRQALPDLRIQFLQTDHTDLNFIAVNFIILPDRVQDLR